MTVATNAMQHLALWIHHPGHDSSPPVRSSLEEALLPAVRCAVRTGVGAPALVRWVRGALRDLRPVGGTEDRAAGTGPMSSAGVERELCHRLATYLRSRPAPGSAPTRGPREGAGRCAVDTVVGP
jgi:hypothetical protein